jgi:hypothetical protein
MADVVLICNRALQLIKNTKRIAALTEGTKEANACEVIYDEMRDTLLEMHQWNFATKRVQLARLTDPPAFEWDYAYSLPSDCLRVVSVHPSSDGRGTVYYKLENGNILTDEKEVYLRYIARVEDPNLMPPTFRNALVKLMASSLAVGLAQSTSLSQTMYDQFIDQDLPTAKSADALQDRPDQMPESDWILARFGDTNYYVDPAEPV